MSIATWLLLVQGADVGLEHSLDAQIFRSELRKAEWGQGSMNPAFLCVHFVLNFLRTYYLKRGI